MTDAESRPSLPVAAGHELAVVDVGSRAPLGRFRVGKIVGVGRNYLRHIVEMAGSSEDEARTVPPVLFLKPSTALVPAGGPVILPVGFGAVHHEVELVAVIGRQACRVPREQALEWVFGYAVGLDLTLRDLQARAKRSGEPWAMAKGFDSSAPVSPVVPRDAVGDGSGLEISLRVNGELRQQASTSRMIRPVADLVAYASELMTLEPGDLLFTGTPEGVGPIEPGDVLEARIDKVGDLRVEARTG